jgi:hypothetical protein
VSLSQRKSGHKNKSKIHTTRNVYQHLNSIGWDAVDIVLIETYACNTKMNCMRESDIGSMISSRR